MESKKFCLGEHFTPYDDLKEKMKKYEDENFLDVWTDVKFFGRLRLT